MLILTVEPFRGAESQFGPSGEHEHIQDFLLIIQEKLIKSRPPPKKRGENLKLRVTAAADMKNLGGFSSSLFFLFLRLTFLSSYVMLAESGPVVNNEFF